MTLIGSVGRWHGRLDNDETSRRVMAGMIEKCKKEIARRRKRVAAEQAFLDRERKKLKELRLQAIRLGVSL